MRLITVLLLACLAIPAISAPQPTRRAQTQAIVTGKTSTGVTSPAYQPWGAARTFQVQGETTNSTGAAEVEVQVSNDGTNYLILCTVTLSLTTTTSGDACSSIVPWRYVRADVNSISGTGANVDVYMGTE